MSLWSKKLNFTLGKYGGEKLQIAIYIFHVRQDIFIQYEVLTPMRLKLSSPCNLQKWPLTPLVALGRKSEG